MDKIRKQKIYNGKEYEVISDMNSVNEKMSRPTETYATLYRNSWTKVELGYTQQVTLDIANDSNDVVTFLSPRMTSQINKDRVKCGVRCTGKNGKTVSFFATEKPTYDLEYVFLVDVKEAELHANLIDRINDKAIIEEIDGRNIPLSIKFVVTDEIEIPQSKEIKVSPNMGLKIE